MTQKHTKTPTPWRAWRMPDDRPGLWEISADHPNGVQSHIATLKNDAMPTESEANAALIVRAVNAHEALVSALEAIVKWADDNGLSKTPSGGFGVFRYDGTEYEVYTKARAAIRAARGGA